MGPVKMEENDRLYFKELLTNWLQDLYYHADSTVGGLLDWEVNSAEYLDRASFETERSTALRIRDRESMLINKIRSSLEDIENGEYGICEDCGKEIGLARLNARPIARHCIKCKTRQEALEKIVGA